MSSDAGIISGISLSHTQASLAQLEAATTESQQQLVSDLLSVDGVSEAYALQTCNRVEAYVVTDEPETGRALLAEQFADLSDDVIQEFGHEQSLRHLLRVAAGLESLVLGEDQILGQVRTAYEEARQVDGIGPLLDDAVTKAIRAGERARTETAINEGVVSLASAAVRLASEKHGLDGERAVVVGAGEMGTLAAKRLAPRVDDLVLANRTVERAEALASRVDEPVETVALDALPDAFEDSAVVISATSADKWIVGPDALASIGETFVVDITRPRDIPPAADDYDHLTVYDLDRLESVTEKTRQRRRQAAKRVEFIVDEEFDRLLVQYKRKRADQVISAMYESAERVKAQELAQTFAKLELDEDSEAVIESMADTIVSQLLAPPTNSLRDAAENDDWTTIHTALRLFNPNLDAEDVPEEPGEMPIADLAPDEIPDGEIPDHVREQLPPAVLEQIED